jgi:hypothetical protein
METKRDRDGRSRERGVVSLVDVLEFFWARGYDLDEINAAVDTYGRKFSYLSSTLPKIEAILKASPSKGGET